MDHCFFIKIVQNSYLATISTLLYSSAYLLPLCYFGAEKSTAYLLAAQKHYCGCFLALPMARREEEIILER